MMSREISPPEFLQQLGINAKGLSDREAVYILSAVGAINDAIQTLSIGGSPKQYFLEAEKALSNVMDPYIARVTVRTYINQ